MIKIRNLEFEYFDRDHEGNLTDMIDAVRGINFDAKKGEFIAIAGKNGSGKSTFARILNRLLIPIEGTVVIGGLDALDPGNEFEIRKKVGMVFQNPDDQIVGITVAEDAAFGAENIGVRQSELWDRVYYGLREAGLPVKKEFARKRINELSGGEKQKCAIAGVLAMKPECIVLDESTSMLDPASRKELLGNIKRLNNDLGITVILITHIMEELIYADKVYIMHMGRIVMCGRREAVFADVYSLEKYGLELPEVIKLRDMLIDSGVINNQYVFDVDAIAEQIKREHPRAFLTDTKLLVPETKKHRLDPKNAILFHNVSFQYDRREVLKHINFEVSKGEYVCIMGPSGAGKSTLLQHIPALLRASAGEVYVDGLDVADKTTDIRKLRCKIGYVFQFADQQLFADNVYEDVVFGPRNVGISEVEAEKRAYEAIKLVGLSEDVYDIPIKKLSGGQRKRVALAGVLAMKPEYLILDEPLSGLDPCGRQDMLEIIDRLHMEEGMTILMICHDAEVAAQYADRVVVMEDGCITLNGSPSEVFYERCFNSEDCVDVPVLTRLLVKLRRLGMPIDCTMLNARDAVWQIAEEAVC